MLPISAIVNIGRNTGEGILDRNAANKRRHKKHPERVLMPKSLGILCWFLVLLWVGVSAIGWIAFDENSDPGDLATRWGFSVFGVPAVVLLMFYYNSYAETYDDHIIYRTWLRRVHRIDYNQIVAYRHTRKPGREIGLTLWTSDGKRKFFQLRIFDLEPAIEYVKTHDVEDRTKPPRWWR